MGNPERVIHIGESGAGQICKVCNQMAIGGTLAVVSELMALATKAGVDPAKVREALIGGFAASRVLEVHGERILKKNYKPGFRAGLYNKDMGIAMETARSHQRAGAGERRRRAAGRRHGGGRPGRRRLLGPRHRCCSRWRGSAHDARCPTPRRPSRRSTTPSDALGIAFTRFTHPPVFTVEEAERYWADIPAAHCKNLFLRNAKGTRHYLVVLGALEEGRPAGAVGAPRRRQAQLRVAGPADAVPAT